MRAVGVGMDTRIATADRAVRMITTLVQNVNLTPEHWLTVRDAVIAARPSWMDGVGKKCATRHPLLPPKFVYRTKRQRKTGMPYRTVECLVCHRIREKMRTEPTACCGHPARSHSEDGCWHRDANGNLDCECTEAV